MAKMIIPAAIAGIIIIAVIIGFTSMSTSDIVLDNAFDYQSENAKESFKNSKSDREIIYEAAEIIKKRDCKQFIEWYDYNSQYVRELSFMHEPDLDSYQHYCEDPNTVLDGNGIDIEEKWSMYDNPGYDKWDRLKTGK